MGRGIMIYNVLIRYSQHEDYDSDPIQHAYRTEATDVYNAVMIAGQSYYAMQMKASRGTVWALVVSIRDENGKDYTTIPFSHAIDLDTFHTDV